MDLNQRRNVSAPLMPQHQAIHHDVNPRVQRHVKIVEVNGTLEMSLQALLHLFASQGAQFRRHHVQGDNVCGQENHHHGYRRYDDPFAHCASVPRCFQECDGSDGRRETRLQSTCDKILEIIPGATGFPVADSPFLSALKAVAK